MKTFVILINGKVENKCYTSLKGACEHAKVNYFTAKRGKRVFLDNDNIVILTEVEVVRIKGRENNAKSKFK